MTGLGDRALRQLALTAVTRYAGGNADSAAVGAAARRAHQELARVAAPLIGAMGVDALTGRAVHLARRDHPWLADTAEPAPPEGSFDAVVARVQEQQDPGSAAAGAAGVLATIGGLLVSLIGDGLTSHLLRQAWPIGFLEDQDQEVDP